MQGKTQQGARIFFHELIGLIEHYFAGRGLRAHLMGGRGTGKSFILSRLKLKNPRVVSFRDRKLDEALSRELRSHQGALFLDDVDEDFNAEMNELLLALLSEFQYPVIIASTLRSDLAALQEKGAFEGLSWTLETDSWSSSTSQFEPFEIEPWESGWASRVARLVADVLPSKDAGELAGYTTIVLDLTGGHPLMLNEALDAIGHTPRVARHHERTSINWRQEHAKLEEQLFGSGLRKLRKFVAWLDAVSPSAGEELRRLARGEEPHVHRSAATRRALGDSGLVCRTPEQKMVVAGEALRHFLAANMAPPPVVVRQTGPGGGEICVSIANSTVAVPLRRGAWKLVEALQNSENPMTIEALMRKTKLQEGALRSAIQRIRSDFDDCGVSNVIENVWGEGYRLSLMPLLTPRALEQ
ncbi:MAG: helix-turn-helix domain-containing protein [Acidobacteriota bacterium]